MRLETFERLKREHAENVAAVHLLLRSRLARLKPGGVATWALRLRAGL